MPKIMELLRDSLSTSHSTELGSPPQKSDQIDRLREYVVDGCEDFLQVEGNFLFKAYEWPEIVDLLDEEEKAYRLWKQEQAQLIVLMNSNPERPVWLYPEPSAQPFYRSFRKKLIKELMVAMRRTFDSTDIEQTFWEIRQYVKRSRNSPLQGGPLVLQRKGNYDGLLDLCRKDLNNLPDILSEDQKNRHIKSIGRYMNKYFWIMDEVDEKPIWALGFLAQQHRRRLGFPDEKVDKCRNSPPNRPTGPPFSRLRREKTFPLHQ